MHVLRDIFIAGEEPIVGVSASGARVVVASAEVAIAANAFFLTAYELPVGP